MSKRNLILFDDQAWSGLRPLTWLRPVSHLRIGALTMAERWELLLTGSASQVTQGHLAEQYPLAISRDNYFVNASVIPTAALVQRILALSQGEALIQEDELLAARLDDRAIRRISQGQEGSVGTIPGYTHDEPVTLLRRPYDLFSHNARLIKEDVQLLCGARHSQPLSETNTVIGDRLVFLEPGAQVEACILNVSEGPIYIGKDAQVQEGSMLRGPIAVCQNARVKMGTTIYGGTTVGPYCTVSGELNNVLLQAYSNKGHAGYLGNAVIGQWCNIGADTNASNLKNNYGTVQLWDYGTERPEPTGRTFCGLIMGDHAKCGINTMFNTGTVVGTAANVFGAGFPAKFVPDFTWGGPGQVQEHRFDKACETADRMMARRGLALSDSERESLGAVFAQTEQLRATHLGAVGAA